VKSGFQVKPESVVQVAQGGNLLVVTDPRNNVDNVKITDASGKVTELVNTNGDTFSLSGIAPGIYTLDIIVNQPNSNTRAAYETILVILQPGQAPQNPSQIIQKVKVVTDVSITFEDDDGDDGCSNKPGSAGLKFPQDKRTECEKEEYDECQENRKANGREWGGGRCDNMYELFWDDDCFGFENSRDCDNWFNDREKFCEDNPNHKKCIVPDPGCDEGYVFHNGECKPICGEVDLPEGELCLDDGDEITCDGPAVPRGNECVLPEDDPCGGLEHIPEDRDCDGKIDDEFLGGPPTGEEEPVEESDDSESGSEDEDEGNSEENRNDNEDESNDDGNDGDNGDSSDGEVFASD
jgi:hypothetical protein